jgi:GT2 family glycosyltransferase
MNASTNKPHSPEPAPRVVVIILNWNGWRYTLECLESLFQIDYPAYDVFIVDNGSTDESIEKIREYCSGKIEVQSTFFQFTPINKPIEILELTEDQAAQGRRGDNRFIDLLSNRRLILIKNAENRSFAEGNNIGMRYALAALSPDYIFLLNNDTVVDPHFLDDLVFNAEKDERIGICGPKLLKMHDPRIIDSTGHVFHWGTIVDRGDGEIDTGQYDSMTDIIGAIAAAVLYKRSMLEDIGLFDPTFTISYEDAELSWRAYNSGWKAKFVPTSIIYHKRGGTVLSSKTISRDVEYHNIENVIRTVRRHGTSAERMAMTAYYLKLALSSQIGSILGKNTLGMGPYLAYLKELYRNGPE